MSHGARRALLFLGMVGAGLVTVQLLADPLNLGRVAVIGDLPKVGTQAPNFKLVGADLKDVTLADFKGKKVALFAVPGAYTGTCHKMHLPSIFLNAYAMKGKGVDTIAIVSVNDAFVMNAWKRDTDQRDEAVFLADGNADFTKAIGLELDASANGLGIRSKRYSMLVEDGVVKKLNLEPAPGKVEVSGGETLLGQL